MSEPKWRGWCPERVYTKEKSVKVQGVEREESAKPSKICTDNASECEDGGGGPRAVDYKPQWRGARGSREGDLLGGGRVSESEKNETISSKVRGTSRRELEGEKLRRIRYRG